jgi:putative peptidoglycan lipid II flippase
MKKTAFLIIIISLISKLLGFGREIVLSFYFGASNVTDSYLIAMTIPSVIIGFISMGIATVYIPMQSKVIHAKGNQEADIYTSNLSNILLLLLFCLYCLGMVLTPFLVKIFAYGFSGEQFLLTVSFTRIMMAGIFFAVLVGIFTGYLQIQKKFVIPALVGFPLNIIIIVATFIASNGNIYILVFGTLLANVSQFIFLIPFVLREKFKYRLIMNFKDENIKRSFYLMLPVIIGTSITSVNLIVDRTIASSLIVGGISSLNYANRLIGFVTSIFVSSIITVLYPSLASFVNGNDYEGIKRTITEAINLMLLFILPITVGIWIFSKPIVWMIFGRGVFDSGAIGLTSSALFYYSFGILGIALIDVFSRSFYAFQDTKTPMVCGAFGMILNIVLNIILSRYMGLSGLALATSISLTMTALLLFISFRLKIGPFGMKKVLGTMLKALLASAIMGVFSWLIYKKLIIFFASNALALMISIAAGAIIYFVIIYFMKIEDVDIVVEAVKKKISL